jgi:acetylornithine deacetylase/succinyl-diaminopimelate desuccinylase-like protein
VSDLVELACRLVAIDSVNPDLVPGGAGERELAHFLADWCSRAGLQVEVEEVAPGRPNVVTTARGTGGGRTLMLNAHTDTVGVAGMEAPFEPRLEGTRLYGRGAYDMKASVAAIMVAAARAKELRLRGDVVATAVADEEVASVGTEAIAARRVADAAIVAEPTEERLAIAHKGFAAFEVETAGRSAHGSRPDLGVDAIARMGGVLVRLGELDRTLRAGAAHPLLGTGSIHASLIEGGQEYSSYPARCLVVGERRTVPGEGRERLDGEVRELLGELDGRAQVTFVREPFEIPADAEIAVMVQRHAGDPEVVGVPFWADSALLAAAGIPTVVFGPAGAGAHAGVEWVDVESAERCCDVYVAVAAELCA